ncbi:MAG: hypothetical protein B7X86_14150 [Sphingobacteriales bacterium 17-39-43]|uniref:glycosyltransferase n=1 Tax=Daejeonella sp. TaxID=2805397 RepID=UPI000BDD73E3|nr:glycosyltransferase [Daejeonella sp.]OYZ30208.1 MAG: hypothetical protein B7Y24_13915 [Sphingobacteriales bacterium 16-39-50]OZA22951.1 MAG: hypothetical protein B7X86_14150 [Sphingobacteriales bacterium 17-39-43]HQT24155.1 glycosyltransferase [Daejeonella sp.]HQT58765.1 glycosyltransferase [Daejeonella sp.]
MKSVLLVENSGLDFYKSRLKYAKSLIDDGFKVYILIPDDGYADLIQGVDLIVYTYDLKRNTNWLKQFWQVLRVFKKIFQEIEVDIIHSFRFFPNLMNVMANLFSRRKTIIHITGLGIAYSNKSLKFRTYRLISDVIYLFLVCFSKITIVQNPSDKKDLTFFNFLKAKIKLVEGSGVDTLVYNIDTFNRDELRDKFKIGPTDLLFICVSRLIWEKGIVELVNAFTTIGKEFENVKLYIVGGPDLNNPRHVTLKYIAENEGNKNVCFLGERGDVKELLAASDVFIYPSYYREGIPRGLLEALSMSLPLIVADSPGCNLTVEDGKNGFLVEPRSDSAIVYSVKNILNNPHLLNGMGSYSRQLAIDKFSDVVIFQKIKTLYSNI